MPGARTSSCDLALAVLPTAGNSETQLEFRKPRAPRLWKSVRELEILIGQIAPTERKLKGLTHILQLQICQQILAHLSITAACHIAPPIICKLEARRDRERLDRAIACEQKGLMSRRPGRLEAGL